MSSFEERALRAACDADKSVEGVHIPELRHRRSAAARITLATGGSIAVLLIALTTIFVRNDDPVEIRSDELTQTAPTVQPAPDGSSLDPPTESPAYFTFPDRSDRHVIARNRRSLADALDGSSLHISIYVAGDESNPIADGLIVVALLDTPNADRPRDGTEIRVRETTGLARQRGTTERSAGIEWVEPSGVVVQVESSLHDVEQLVSFAETLEIDGTMLATPQLPIPMTALVENAEHDSVPLPTSGWSVHEFSESWDLSAALYFIDATPDSMTVTRSLLGLTKPVDVRGTTGWWTTNAVDPTEAVLAWQEAGTILALGGVLPLEQLVEIAETLVPLSEDRWHELVDASHPGNMSTGPPDGEPSTFQPVIDMVAETSTTVGGTTRRSFLYLSVDGEYCFEWRDGDDGNSRCSPLELTGETVLTYGHLTAAGVDAVDGNASLDVARVLLDTSTRQIEVVLHRADDAQIFGVVLEPGEVPEGLIAFDDSDGVIEIQILPGAADGSVDVPE
ncbi:MAG: hypothetical protein AAGA37_10390 [Actinomycetota bacterium]